MNKVFGKLMVMAYRLPKFYETPHGINSGITGYIEVMGDISDADMWAALMRFLRSPNDYGAWPKAGQLLAFVESRQAAALDDSDEQWGKLLDLVSSRGRNNPPGEQWHLSDRVSAGLAGVGGWRILCLADETNLVAHRAAFRSAYRSGVKQTYIKHESDALAYMLSNRHQSEKLIQ